jgi:hypothetical protein
MNKKIMFLMCLLMAMVWTAGCSCPAVRPVVAAPAPVVEPPPPPPPPEVIKPAPVVQPAPSKKLKQRVIKGTED